jgi:hypothetical protein
MIRRLKATALLQRGQGLLAIVGEAGGWLVSASQQGAGLEHQQRGEQANDVGSGQERFSSGDIASLLQMLGSKHCAMARVLTASFKRLDLL